LHNEVAKRYAIEVVMRGREVLVIFPEGEIYYLNDPVQPFKSGAVDIGMQAVVEARRTRPGWAAYLVPMAFKYRYRGPIAAILERRTRSMERLLNIRIVGLSLQQRLAQVMAGLLGRHELAHHLRPAADRLTELDERVQEVRKAILAQAEARYVGATARPPAQTMDRAWRLSSYLRGLLSRRGPHGGEDRDQARMDLASSESVAQMAGWQPRYTEEDPSQERLAEMVIKLEREVYRTKRPRQLARRDLFLRIGEPIDLGRSIPDYLRDARAVRLILAERLRGEIQHLLELAAPPGIPKGNPGT
jgi:hypothetical protein